MADTVVEALILDLPEWLAARERSYEEVLEARGARPAQSAPYVKMPMTADS